MSTSRDRVIGTLNHEPVDRAPRDLWVPPATETLRGDEVQEMLVRYSPDIVKPDFAWPRGDRSGGLPHGAAVHMDAWGVAWQAPRREAAPEAVQNPLADLAGLPQYRAPMELLDEFNRDRVNRSCASTSRFVLAWSETRPLERLQLLRGSQAALADLVSDTREIRQLLAMLHEFSCREMEIWARSDVDGIVLADDWGTREGLVLGTSVWRGIFRPLYREYCKILRAKDKFVFFRTSGQIAEILRDLVDMGVDAIRVDLPLLNLEALARKFRGRITFWGGTDGEPCFAAGKPEEVRATVENVRKALDFGRGGLIAQCQWNAEAPFTNVAALFEAWLQPVLAHA